MGIKQRVQSLCQINTLFGFQGSNTPPEKT